MDCDKTRTMLVAALDGAVTDAEQRELTAHVAGCRACAAEDARLRRLADVLVTLGGDCPVPQALEDGVLRRVRSLAADPAPPWRERLRGWLSVPAFAAAAVAAVVLVVATRDDPAPDPTAPRAVERLAAVGEGPRVAARSASERPARPAVGPETEPGAGPVHVASGPPVDPPAELLETLPILLDLRLLKNMEKLDHYDAIGAMTHATERGPNG